MDRYTIETLSCINDDYIIANHEIRQRDVDMVNAYIELIESSRSVSEPRPGDIIRYTDPYGTYYPHTHIEYIADGKANTCENAYVHICRNDENMLGFRLVSSGGSWANLPVSKMKYAGQEEKRFWDFGSGIYRTRGIDFYATVNVWMCDLNEDLFSTMTHNKYYLYFLKQGRNGDHFFLSSRESGDRAWKTEEELQAWIRTYRGTVSCFREKQAVVWTYRERYHFVSPEQYDNLEAQEDVMLMNGLRYCKRIYDDKNYILHTYFVWYWEDPSMGTFDEAAAKQNEIRKKYEIYWRTDCRPKENDCALRELREGIAEAVDLQPLYRQ